MRRPICRLIAPDWLAASGVRRVIEGELSQAEIRRRNDQGYNVYYLPNRPSTYTNGQTVKGCDVDEFRYVFVDYDVKTNVYPSKAAFITEVGERGIEPSRVVDSGNGVHVYWRVSDLDAKSYLRLSRRMMRLLKTDDAVGQIFQLMRLPGTMNTKREDDKAPCVELFSSDAVYTCEELDKHLPTISVEDEEFCNRHYDMTYNAAETVDIDEALPAKFGRLCSENHEVKTLWAGNSDDRSRDDFRLGHIMFASDFTKDEAMSVLVNTAKAASRAPAHRINYAKNIVDKIWTYEAGEALLSDSVEDILKRSGDTIKGMRFRCHRRIDNTVHGFRLGHVIGLVAGVGVGKTSFTLNMFRWFAQENPDYHHMFVPLEQPANEIADRWTTMVGEETALNSKIHVMSNYDAEGNFRHLSLDDIKEYILRWQETTGNKLGCVVIDHIGVLKKKGANDEKQDLMTICHSMKAFAVQTNTLLVMQSQTSREKAGIGDLELNKDAAYGTTFFEAYCDYMITMWQPLKRCHKDPACPTVAAFKFCKIRHKKTRRDIIQEDIPYYLFFDSETEQLRDLTEDEETSFGYFLKKATNLRKVDRKSELLEYRSVPWREETNI